ncbi:hypothetical protein G5I_10150 [Acromyrmex echinatior]|uniref:Uncharacterized protein n=1 Tax=Acromyrmex echinatior TaxID=103372 RepID=F4WVZ7_ACREC|nr:hypothetical protein G5I_10150 [Acromyrmex echinatior]
MSVEISQIADHHSNGERKEVHFCIHVREIFLIAVTSIAWVKTENVGRSVRAPQEQIKYADSDDSRFHSEYLALQGQLRSQQANAQRSQRAEGGSSLRLRQAQQLAQPQPQQAQQQAQAGPQYYSYKPYSAVPNHIKQLIDSVYQPQAPYVDPTSFIYGGNYFAAAPQQREQPAPAASEYPRGAYLQPAEKYQSIDPQRAQPRNMPTEIKQLLKYQAQIPYDLTANRIQYTPKNVFVPKPLPNDAKGPYYYRSKIYYPNDDNIDAEYSQNKPVDEEQRH